MFNSVETRNRMVNPRPSFDPKIPPRRPEPDADDAPVLWSSSLLAPIKTSFSSGPGRFMVLVLDLTFRRTKICMCTC